MELLFLFFTEPFVILLETAFSVAGRIMDTSVALLIALLCGNIVFLPLFLLSKRKQNQAWEREHFFEKEGFGSKALEVFLQMLPLLLTISVFLSVRFFVKEMTILEDGIFMLPGTKVFYLPVAYLILSGLSVLFFKKRSKGAIIVNIIETVIVFGLLFFVPLGVVCFFLIAALLSAIIRLIGSGPQKSKGGGKSVEKQGETITKKEGFLFFFLGILYLILLLGFYIPTNIIKLSPEEFVDVVNLKNPMRYVLYSMLLSTGSVGIWGTAYYLLCENKIRRLFEKAVWILAGIASVNYIVAGSYLGQISPALEYFEFRDFETPRVLISFGIAILIAIIVYVIMTKKPEFMKLIILAELSILIISIGMNSFSIIRDYSGMDYLRNEKESRGNITFSRNGQNVLVIIADRALGPVLPFAFEEKPELKEQFDGFTYYANTISFAPCTRMGIPAVYGGYEYTPESMNARPDETLETKHDEALKVLPVLFSENDYKVTVLDPAYAGYNWIPDLSVFDEYPEIDTYNTNGKFNDTAPDGFVSADSLLKRNFFVHSVMKVAPLNWQSLLYNESRYCNPDYNHDENSAETPYVAEGYNSLFIDAYMVLKNLPEITYYDDSEVNHFISFYNLTPHTNCLLQEPDYTPAQIVDNRVYHDTVGEERSLNDKILRLQDLRQISHYHTNMATYIELGKWFDELRENDCYDNTRIIIVADHGSDAGHFNSIISDGMDIENFMPVLMVKDFNAKGFNESEEIMTNADVAALATQGVISNPVNPFTGNPLDSHEKEEMEEFHIFYSKEFDLRDTNEYIFTDGHWFTVHDDPYDLKNWTYLGRELKK